MLIFYYKYDLFPNLTERLYVRAALFQAGSRWQLTYCIQLLMYENMFGHYVQRWCPINSTLSCTLGAHI